MIIPLQVPDGTKRIHVIIVHPGEDGKDEYENEIIYVDDPVGCYTYMKEQQTISYADTLRQLITKG